MGVRTELARYTTTQGTRILYGQRIDGVVRVTDRPATPGHGRALLVERGLEHRGELDALVADYLSQARLLDRPPAAGCRPAPSEPRHEPLHNRHPAWRARRLTGRGGSDDAPTAAQSPRILLVEANPTNQAFLSDNVAANGDAVTIAKSEPAASEPSLLTAASQPRP